MKIFSGPQDLLAAAGTELGPGDWVVVDQERIDAFARTTDDSQWIHTDPVRAAQGPFGVTIAHGFLTLSLLTTLCSSLYAVEDVAMGINYGLDRVRFLTPVPAGSRVRAAGRIASASTTASGGVRVAFEVSVEVEDQPKPALVADFLVLYPAV